MTVIAVLAIMASIAIPTISHAVKGSKAETARRNLNLLNGAVSGFNDANWELVLAAGSGSEKKIFDSLRYRAADNPTPGSPYLPENATCVESSDKTTYRAQWNGRVFKLLPAGTSGTGLDLLKIMGSSVQTPPTSTPIPPSK